MVHIHENVKIVGGSRAEDHMSKCAITDVYELHQNSQDLAVQCEPLSEVKILNIQRRSFLTYIETADLVVHMHFKRAMGKLLKHYET